MRVGTITFHWVTNYGAVLQAYALQKFLLKNGYETEVINYVPYAVKYRQILSNIKRCNIDNLIKEYKINKFRKKNMFFSSTKYYKNSELKKVNQLYDLFICGSDQVWNEWFLLNSEPSINLSYYLNFVSEEKKRISYATSFGTDKLQEKVIKIVEPELRKFSTIYVRENTGKKIINDMGLKSNVVVDPTLLLERECYEQLLNEKSNYKKFDLFSYVLHQHQDKATKITNYIYNKFFDAEHHIKFDGDPISINEWLYNVKNSKLVVTNSFHGAIFSIIFHTRFIVILVENSKMNDRIITLLSSLGLEDRLVENFDTAYIDNLLHKSIEWSEVDLKLQEIRENSTNMIIQALKESN